MKGDHGPLQSKLMMNLSLSFFGGYKEKMGLGGGSALVFGVHLEPLWGPISRKERLHYMQL